MQSKSERLEIKTKEPLRILCVGDVHAPFSDQGRLVEVIEFAKEFKPNFIVQIGDLYDQYTHSKYPKAEIMRAEFEDGEARQDAAKLWSVLQLASPKARCYQLRGNHDIRAMKRVLEKAPDLEKAVFTYYDNLYKFRGVTTMADDRSELVINDILFIHGYLANLGDHVKYNRQSTVVGHSHKGGVLYFRHKDKTLFELNCGHVANDKLLPSSYTQQRTTFWTPGFGVIETMKNGSISPRFIPL